MIQTLNLQLDAVAKAPLPSHAGPPGQPIDPQHLVPALQVALGERWEVVECLALGGMAVVFQIRHRAHQALLVAKVLRPELMGRPEVLRSFSNEAKHAARLGGHPNAVPVLDVLLTADLAVLVMPFVDGEDLDLLLRRHGPLSKPEALQFAAQLGSLLAYAESHGIAHADLSSGNIRLDLFGRYRVLDFGLSHARDSTELPCSLGGTPLYTSPEQLRGEAPDVRTDLYALGLLLVEVLTGAPLFAGETLDTIRQRHLDGYGELPAPLREDPGLARLLAKLLARERTDRFQSALEFTRALAGLGFEPPELLRPLAGHARRHRLSGGQV